MSVKITDNIIDAAAGPPLVFIAPEGGELTAWYPSARRLVALATNNTEPHTIAEPIMAILASEKIRFGNFIGIGEQARLILYLAVNYPNIVKRCVLINPELTPGGSIPSFTSLISRIEHYLPLGLPFRRKHNFWDVRCFAHRIKAPCLGIFTADHEATISSSTPILKMIPCITIEYLEESKAEAITQFEGVPAKVPMRGNT